MSFDAHANLAFSTIATAPSPATSGTSLTVASGEGALFPTAPFNALCWPANEVPSQDNAEIVRVTDEGSGDDWTITRAQEGTSAQSIDTTFAIAATATAKTFTDLETAINAKADNADLTTHTSDTSNPHSVTKAQVGLGNVTNNAQLKASDLIDEDDMSSDSATKVPTQQSVKAYVDANAGGGGGGATDEGFSIHLPMSLSTGIPGEVASSQSSGATISSNNWQTRAIQDGPTSGQYGAWYSRIGSKYTGDKVFPAKGGVMLGAAGSAGDGVLYYHFITTNSTPGTTTADHIGLQFDKVSGTTTPNTSTANGTTQQKVAITGITLDFTGNTSIRYTWVYDGTSVSFYCDGVLKNTHSTNVPRTTSSQSYTYVNSYKGIITSANIYTALVNHYNLILGITH